MNDISQEWHRRTGANFSFEYLKKICPAIPALAEVIDHVAENFDLPYRSHAHQSPDAQRDIRVMAERFHQRKVLDFIPGREVENEANRAKDYIASGTSRLQKPATWSKIFKPRMEFLSNHATGQDFDSPEVVNLADRLQRVQLGDQTAAAAILADQS